MHGRRKECSTSEMEASKSKERAIKLTKFTAARDLIVKKQKNGVYDMEGLVITHKLLSSNPDIYTLWNYRRKAILSLMGNDKVTASGDASHPDDGLLKPELELTQMCIREQPKSYSAWHQRGWILKHLVKPNYKAELELCDDALSMDERNFHCWDHRRLVCQLAGIQPQQELAFAVKKINHNFSNYSAWHYKSSLLPLMYADCEKVLPICSDKLIEELEIATNAFFTDPEDESAWMYTNWLFSKGISDCHLPTDQSVLCLDINFRKRHVVLVLLHETCILEGNIQVELSVNGQLIECSWTPIGENITFAQTRCWESRLPETEPNDAQVSIEYDNKWSLTALAKCADGKSTYRSETLQDLVQRETGFGCEIPETLSNALEKMLSSCLELVKEEPKNKWPLLISTLTMMRIDPIQYCDTIIHNHTLLETLDSKRKAYYVDSSSKFKINKAIFDQLYDGGCVLDVSGLQLSRIPFCAILSLVENLNISKNCLLNLKNLSHFACLQNLDASSNPLQSISEIDKLHRLESVTIVGCPKLEIVGKNATYKIVI